MNLHIEGLATPQQAPTAKVIEGGKSSESPLDLDFSLLVGAHGLPSSTQPGNRPVTAKPHSDAGGKDLPDGELSGDDLGNLLPLILPASALSDASNTAQPATMNNGQISGDATAERNPATSLLADARLAQPAARLIAQPITVASPLAPAEAQNAVAVRSSDDNRRAATQAFQAVQNAAPPAAATDKANGLPQVLTQQAGADVEQVPTDPARTVETMARQTPSGEQVIDPASPPQTVAQDTLQAQGTRTQATGFTHMVRNPQAVEQLIENLVSAREAGRSVTGEMRVRNEDFGAVTLRLTQADGELRAVLGARDHGLVIAAQSALAERQVVPVHDSAASHNRGGGNDNAASSQQGSNGRDPGAHAQGELRDQNRPARPARDDLETRPGQTNTRAGSTAQSHSQTSRGLLA